MPTGRRSSRGELNAGRYGVRANARTHTSASATGRPCGGTSPIGYETVSDYLKGVGRRNADIAHDGRTAPVNLSCAATTFCAKMPAVWLCILVRRNVYEGCTDQSLRCYLPVTAEFLFPGAKSHPHEPTRDGAVLCVSANECFPWSRVILVFGLRVCVRDVWLFQ